MRRRTRGALRRQAFRDQRFDCFPSLSACLRMPRAAIERRAVRRDQHRPEPASTLRSASLGVDAAERLAAVILQRPVVGDRGGAVCDYFDIAELAESLRKHG